MPWPAMRRLWSIAAAARHGSGASASARALAVSARPTTERAGEEELDKARAWLAGLSLDNLPKLPSGAVEMHASRSSGPGGQNVNKVNTKATMRIDVPALLPQVPPILHSALLQSPYYKHGVNKLVFQCDDSRKLNQNKQECWAKFCNVLIETGAKTIPGKTSAAQQQRVKKLEKAANERRLREKKSRSSKKSSRSGGGAGDL